MSIFDKIEQTNKQLYEQIPEVRGFKWSGCDYIIFKNDINNQTKKLAQSVRNCETCKCFNICRMKKDNPVWFYNKEIREELEILADQLMQKYVTWKGTFKWL